jgi:cytoskeletal protein CcmA (bactofilin family)
MAYSYTRQSTISDGDTITAALFNNEYNELLNSFAYSSSDAAVTGHRHDGSAAQGGSIFRIGDLDFLNKIEADSTNNRWGFYVQVSSSAVEQIRVQDGAIVPVTDNDIDLGTSSLEFKDAYFDGTVTSDAFAGPLTGDVTGNVSGTAATVTTAAQSNITSLGTLTTLTVDNVIINGTTIGHTSDTDLLTLTSGVLTVAGEVDATSLDISGNVDIDGTTNLDAVDIDGVVQIDGATTFGVDDTGVDVKFFGDTASAYLLWDTSADKLLTAGGAVIDIVKDKLLIGGTAVTTTAAELNVLDAVTAGTVTASLGVVVDSNKDIGTFRNITLSGELDAGSLDVSGNADIDGTLEADAITVDGTALDEYIADTVGAMVGSNTESGITVAYQDGDNTLDFTVGTLNQDTTGTAAIATTVTITDNENTNENNALIFTSGGDLDGGNLGLESDGDLHYNPSTGLLTATSFAGALTGNVTGNASGTAATVTGAAQSNITSLGTLTTLTVDNVIINGTTIGHTDDTDLLTVADGVLTVAGEVSMTTLDIGGTNVTATAAELNILDGVTSTAAELNILDGVTATTAELNYLDITTLGTTAASKAVTADANGVVTHDAGTSGEYTAVTSSSNAVSLNLQLGDNFSHDLTENTTISFANPASSGKVSTATLRIIQGSSARTITWHSSIKWAGDEAPTLSTGDDDVDVFVFYTVDAGTTYYGFTAGQDMS